MIRRPPRSTQSRSSAASDVYKRQPLQLIAVKAASAGDEIFNSFGDHGNALLLHKYGFCEWNNTHGGVTVSHDTLFKVLGPEVVMEAEDALNGTSEMVSHLS